jgi:hypothetical protein
MKLKIIIILSILMIPAIVYGKGYSLGIKGGPVIYLGENKNESMPNFGLSLNPPLSFKEIYGIQFNLSYSWKNQSGDNFRDYSFGATVLRNSSNPNSLFFDYLGLGVNFHHVGWQAYYSKPFNGISNKSSHFRDGVDLHFILGAGFNLFKRFTLSTDIVLSRIFLKNYNNTNINLLVAVFYKL